MTREQEKKMTRLIQPLVEKIVKKQKLNESSVSSIYNQILALNSNDEWAELLFLLSKNFKDNAGELTNMRAKEIAKYLSLASAEIDNRTGE